MNLPNVLPVWTVYCPRCGDEFNVRASEETVKTILSEPCRECKKRGVDAVQVRS